MQIGSWKLNCHGVFIYVAIEQKFVSALDLSNTKSFIRKGAQFSSPSEVYKDKPQMFQFNMKENTKV